MPTVKEGLPLFLLPNWPIQKSVKKLTMRDVRKMSAQEYDAALRDTDLGPQIEELLAND